MQDMIINIILGLIGIAVIAFSVNTNRKVKKIVDVISPTPIDFDPFPANELSERDERMIDLFYSKIKNTINQYRYTVPAPLALAVFKQESAGLWRTKPNSEVFGDLNLTHIAIGYMQVRKPALIDVNKRYGYSYSEEDLKIESVNFVVGIGYLDYCHSVAISDGAINVSRNTLQKYNGGISRKENDLSGSIYAATVSQFFINFSGLA